MSKIKNKIKKTLQNNDGFTLSELLVAMLILSLVFTLILDTQVMGTQHFLKRTKDSEVQVLCNTISLSIQDYLTYVNRVEEIDNVIWFVSGANGGLHQTECAFAIKDKDSENISNTKNTYLDTDGIVYLVSEKGLSMPLINALNYAYKSDTDKITLSANVAISINANGYFDVKVQVKGVDNIMGKGDMIAENVFTVVPINSNVFV